MVPSLPISPPVRIAQLDGFVLSERHHTIAGAVAPHAHDVPTLSLVVSGSYFETVGRTVQRCCRSSVQLLPADQPHSFAIGDRVHCLTVEVQRARCESIASFSRVLARVAQVRAAHVAALATRLRAEIVHADSAAPLFVEGLILDLLGSVERVAARDESAAPPWLSRATDAIAANFRSKISLVDLAAQAGVHPSYLARTFRRRHGCSVTDYVRRLRLEWAMRELQRDGRSISDVALDAGFYDHSHFSHAFRSFTGLTPAQFRASSRG